MKKIYLLLSAFTLFFLILSITGCKKDLDFSRVKDITWTPDFAVPLVNDSITFESALIKTGTENNFYIDESGDISILYYFNNGAFKIAVNDLLDLPPFYLDYSHQVTLAEQQILALQDFIIPPTAYSINLTQDEPGVRIDKLLVKKGTLLIHSSNSFNNSGYLKLSILNATKNGLPFSVTITPFRSGNTYDSIDISGVLFDLSSTPNMALVQVEGLLVKSGEPVAGDAINANYTIFINTIGRFEGYLGQRSFTPEEESVRITVFNNAFNYGEIYFVDPRVSMTVYNSIGVPARVTVEKLEAVNSASGARINIADRLGSNAIIPIPSPAITATQPVTVNMVYTNANTGNSMDELFNVKPDDVYYRIKTEINPGFQTLNFFTDTSSLYADLHVQLPLYGHFTNVIVQDTFDFVLNDEETIDKLEFRTNIVNGLPLKARMQVYFTDENYHIIDSLTGNDNILINEAPVDPATHLPIPGMYGVKDTSFFMDHERILELSSAQKMLVRGWLNSSNGGQVNVKIRADQMIKMNFSARVKMKVNLEP